MSRTGASLSGMAEGGVAYPQVFVVENPGALAPAPLPAEPRPRRTSLPQRLLYLLVTLALCGVAVEAFFIARLYARPAVPSDTATHAKQQGGQGDSGLDRKSSEDGKEVEVSPTKRTSPVVKPQKPSAHLTDAHFPAPDDEGVLRWGLNGDAFTHEIKHEGSRLLIVREGYYYIYSKVFFTEPSCAMFKHLVLRSTQRYSKPMELMKSKRFSCSSPKQPEVLNSYLGGVFHLYAGDSVSVKVENRTLVRHQDTSDNFFGMFMV
ncbi:tumor necrosis factor ligand superfamily member 14-like [Megalops cyprinoides]|uniref:tumor necrosis factor ligand superfamily member 14-like n=1 Tax=Megalops cyprinoides TaxID=118141 RepID=UPI001864565E|nr:tumor necrosis factor ligand superfamily member 14-like [Megalops cyprinoides]